MKLKLKNTLFLTLLVCESWMSFSQEGKQCGALISLLRDQEVKKAFHLDLHPEVAIILVDTKNKFCTCDLPEVYGRKVSVTCNLDEENRINHSNIVIKGFVKKRKYYELEVSHKVMQAYGFVRFTKSNAGYKVSKVMIGNF
jgi:hypothetical protein